MGINMPQGRDAAVIKYMPTVQKAWGTDNVHSRADPVACTELHADRLSIVTGKRKYVKRHRPGQEGQQGKAYGDGSLGT